MKSFEEIGIEKNILTAIEELGFENPMPVQEKVIPHLLSDNKADIVALAQTGTGKTAAFGLPLIQRVDTSSNKTQHLIISPTRELCLQIADDLKSYAKYKEKIKIVAVFGGASIEHQIKAIKKGAHIISATPGRLLDLLNRRVVDIRDIETVVLDEADEMLNMGFREDLESILSDTPAEKQTLLFSATMPTEVKKIANKFMHNTIEFTIGKKNSGADTVSHVVYTVQARDRYLALKRIVDFHPDIYGIVFCRTRLETQDIASKLMDDGYNADAIHGDLSQAQRDVVMGKFRTKHIRLLVATDVAARGLDVNDLTHVINYNLPDELDIYTHRSGRTGRAGKEGISIIISNLKEKGKIHIIEKQIGKKIEHKSVPLGKEICKVQLFHLVDRMEKVDIDSNEIDEFLPELNKKLDWLDRDELIKKFVSVEFNRFADYYKNTPDLNKPADERGSRREDGSRGRNTNAGFTRFFLNLGSMDNIRPADLIGMVNDLSGVRDIEIGEIDIKKSFSFFEVDSEYKDQLLDAFNQASHNGRKINLEVSDRAARPQSGGSRRSGGDKPFNRSNRTFSRSDKPSGGSGRSFSKSDKPSSGSGKSYGKSDKSSGGSGKSYGKSDKPSSGSGKSYSRSDKPSERSGRKTERKFDSNSNKRRSK
ncbi:MAG: DEAD/DEAH box helicase [Bacteroidetes bacterium]|nr:DEAD/DEAH box helicase [Bacteroidota bacterium]MBU1116650.1 DEAD/DEAH box helicase [Bacteroidota bacterium]MBU1797499.1 DEAD/DEAH box helicase [Bacteroidota bacterium]